MDRPRQPTKSRWLVYLRLGRVSNLPTVWTNCMAGMVLAGVPFTSQFNWVLVALSLLYTGGMFLNDAFDSSFDKQFRPERPIPSGEVSAQKVYLIGFGMLGAAVLMIASRTDFELGPIVFSLILAGLITYYNYRHKSDPLSPLVMALCRVMVYLVSASIVGAALSFDVLLGAATLGGYLIGLTYIAKQENLNEVKNLWPLLFLGMPVIHFFRGAHLILFMALVAWVLWTLSYLIARPRSVPKTVVGLIAGICLLDATIISAATNDLSSAWLAVAAFFLTVVFQRFIQGT